MKEDADKKIFFKQFSKIFCTGKDHHLEEGEDLHKTLKDHFYGDDDAYLEYC